MSDATSRLDPQIAARLAELEALVMAQQRALEVERARRTDVEAERDRLREAYQALLREVELARRRLVVAKAERIDTTQLELEFAAKLAALDELAGKAEEEGAAESGGQGEAEGEGGAAKPPRGKRKRGRRDLRLLDVPEERVEFTDPVLEGKAARIGTEESSVLRWKRGGLVRVVLVRIKYDTWSPAAVELHATPTSRDESAAVVTAAQMAEAGAAPVANASGDEIAVAIAPERAASASGGPATAAQAAPAASGGGPVATAPTSAVNAVEPVLPEPSPCTAHACTIDELRALVATDPRTADGVIATAPMPPRLLARSIASPSLLGHIIRAHLGSGWAPG